MRAYLATRDKRDVWHSYYNMDIHETEINGDAKVTTITMKYGALLSESERSSGRTALFPVIVPVGVYLNLFRYSPHTTV